MRKKELKLNSNEVYRCYPKRNCVLSISQYMDISLYVTQKWELIYNDHRNRGYIVSKKGLRLFMTESEFNENFEIKYKIGE